MKPLGLEDAGQPHPQEGLVLGDDALTGRHGISRVTTVGPPAGLSTSIVPSKAASRRATPVSPQPGRVGAAAAVVADGEPQERAVVGAARP